MTTPDIIILFCLICAAIRGLVKGFIEQAVAIVSIIAGAWMSFHFAGTACDWLSQYMDVSESTLHVIGFATVAAATIIGLHLLGMMITKLMKLVMLGWLNRLLGMAFALLNTTFILGIVLILFDTLNNNFDFVPKEDLNATIFYHPVKDFAMTVFPYLKALILK